MNSNFLLTLFEFTTIILSIISFILGARELYAKSQNTAYKIKKLLLVISGITIVSATCTWYFSNKVTNQKEIEYKNYRLITQKEISKNKENAAFAMLKSDSVQNEMQQAELKIEGAKSEREELIIKTLELKNENIRLAINLKKEEKKSTDLINSIAPRALEQYHFSNHLKRINDISIKLICVKKEEPISTLGQLNVIFQMAGWKIIETKIVKPDPMIREDINIYRNAGPKTENDHSEEAANALLSQLKLNKIKANIGSTINLPLNTIEIIIGEKSNKFVQEWTSENLRLIMENKETLKKQMSKLKDNIFNELITLYPLGIVLFAIDNNENIIPDDNIEMNFLEVKWDYAKIDDSFGKKVLKLPSIIYKETGDKILEDHNEVAFIKQKYKVKLPWIGFNFKHISCFFETLDFNDKGIFCLIGFIKSKT